MVRTFSSCGNNPPNDGNWRRKEMRRRFNGIVWKHLHNTTALIRIPNKLPAFWRQLLPPSPKLFYHPIHLATFPEAVYAKDEKKETKKRKTESILNFAASLSGTLRKRTRYHLHFLQAHIFCKRIPGWYTVRLLLPLLSHGILCTFSLSSLKNWKNSIFFELVCRKCILVS